MEQNKDQSDAAVRDEAAAELPTIRFRKKPVEIEAIQWTGNLECLDAFKIPELHQSLGSKNVGIPTLEGTMIAHVGDWIIKGVKGEFYPCKPEIFELTYVSTRAADAPSEPSELRLALIDVRHAIQFSYDSVGGIDRMPVMMHHDGTVVEFIDSVLKSRAADALDSQPTAPMINYVRSEWESMCRKAVAVLNKHIVPDGISDHDALNELYGIFDSDEYRSTGAIEQDACEARQAVQMNIDRSFASSQPTDGWVRND